MDEYLTNKIIKKYYNNDIGLKLTFSYNFISYENKDKYYKTKIVNIHNTLSSVFNTTENKNNYMNVLNKYNNVIYKISYLQKKWILYKTKIFDYNFDMTLKSLDEYSSNEIITIIQNDKRYKFTLKDILNIYHHSLMNSEYLDESPLKPKNPFNNIVFNNSVGYNMYICCKLNNIKIPYFVKEYIKCNMDIKRFRSENHFKLFVNAIKNYIYYAETNDLYDEILNLFYYIKLDNLYNIYNVNYQVDLIDYDNASNGYKTKIVKLCKHMLIPYWIHIYKTNKKEPYIDDYYVSQIMNYIHTLCNTHKYFWRETVYIKNESLFSPIHKNIKLFS